MKPEARRSISHAARAVRAHAERSVAYRGARPEYALVLGVDPLLVRLMHSALEFEEDELVISQFVRKYDRDHPIAPGDTLLVHRMPNGDMLVADVVTDVKFDDYFEGIKTLSTASADPTYSDPQGGSVTPNHHIVAKVEFRAPDGTLVGFVPVYGSLP